MLLLQVLFITVCFVATSLASCMPEHPQKQFCRADYVVHAKVLSGPKYGYMPNIRRSITCNVYQLRILETFKGRDHVQKNLLIPDERIHLVNLYAPLSHVSGAVHLKKQL